MELPVDSNSSLIFIDSNVLNYDEIAANISSGFETITLNPNEDGIDQITQVLTQKSNVESIHIISHGSLGSIQIGDNALNSDNLDEYIDPLMSWSEHLTTEADILLYGCDIGLDENFIKQLANLTGADIAASDDLTGNAALGGDGDLEVTTGSIEAELAVFGEALENYSEILHEGHFHNDPVVPNDPNFENELLVQASDPISMEWLPDGRSLVLSKTGEMYITDLQDPAPSLTPYMTLPDVNTSSEKGLIDIAVDPDFESNGYFYLYYTKGSDKSFQISRFTHNGNTGNLGSETVIWKDPTPAGPPDHYGGGLNFGPDGKLYLSIGDKGFNSPEKAQDLTVFEGKVLRFNPDGTVPNDNPFINTPGARPEIWAYGVRNPFRSDWDFQTNNLYIGDVGLETWEEVNRLGINDGGANLGWNQYEGSSNGVPGLTDPIYQFEHINGGAAVIGGSIYRGTMFPSEFQGSYFFADFVAGTMQYLKFDANNNVIDADPSTPTVVDAFNFEEDGPVTRPVFIDQGPDGALYYLNLSRPGGNPGEIRRIVYNDPTGGNASPVINEQATTATKGNGLTVDFTGVATDADGDSLSYTWDFGDGNQATGANISHTYTANGQYTPRLIVSDGQEQDSYLLSPVVLGTPPTANIILRKQDGTIFQEGVDLFKAGDTIFFEADATDADGSLTNNSYSWDIDFLHNTHAHPELNDFVGSSGELDITTTEHGFPAETGFEFILTVTDSDGLTTTEAKSIFPEKIDLAFNDNLPGDFDFTLDGFTQTSSDNNPLTVETAVNFQHEATAPSNVTINGIEYLFDNWSVGSSTVATTATLNIAAPETNQTYTANYIVNDPNPDPEPPVANDDSINIVTGSQDNALNVLANDTDADPGDTLTITGVSATNNGGTVSINSNSDGLIYTPGNGFVGTESFTYTIADSTGNTSSAQVSLNVAEASGVPVTGLVLQLDANNGVTTNNGVVTGWADQSASGNDLTGFGDPTLVTNGLNGQNYISLDGNGDQFVRDSNLSNLPSGNADRTVFMVAKYDGTGNGGFTYGKNFTNEAFGLLVKNDGDLMVQAWGKNDADSNVDGTGAGWLTQSAVLQAGTLNHYKDGTVIDTKTLTYNTFLDKIVLGAEIDSNPFVDMDVAEILVFDRALSQSEQTQVNNYLQQKYFGSGSGSGNQQPSAVADTFEVTSQSTNNTLDVLANDSDPDGDALVFGSVGTPTNGSVEINATNDALLYTPNASFSGTDTFNYSITDGNGGTDQATVTVNVVGTGNGLPNIVNDGFTVDEDSSNNPLDVLVNDTDPENDPLSITSVGATDNGGMVTINNTNDGLVYTPATDFTGTETFTYTVSDGNGGVNTATVTMNVNNVNDAPTAANDNLNIAVDSSNNALDVLVNDTDPDSGDTLTITGVSATNNGGTVSINASNDGLIYTPGNGFVGTESFTYTIADSTGSTSSAQVSLNVAEASGVPVTNGLVLQLDANNGVTTNNGVVTGWADQSASGNDLTGFGDPTLVTNGLNGQNYINLDGDGDQLERDSNLNNLPSGNADRTVFMVAKYDGIGYGGFAYGKNFTNEAFGLLVKNDGDLMVQAWGKNDADSNVDGTGVGWLTQSAVLQAGTLNHYKDGTVIDSRTRTYNTLLDKIVLGSEIDGSPFVDMDVAEILVFDRALSEAEQTQVNNYLQQKYFSV
ncbi:Ig-like domain-containing protein [Lyngbya sp. PCC 8106]|uniref:Ig-like domain-containing protein n=1 Tax=Lyngbya sp. (strain PCC 8106) TaxID=313612 RepID=UPI0000EACDE5|nr:Ig-like domain-containing protein [Lyngbya sp. PCC 8106]EAW35516.1 hypothetical protein L8106_10612 [Lyngbya sp. PCC 8106]